MGTRSAELLRRLAEGPPIISDGGMGAQLLQRGWQGPTEDANLHAPGTVEEIHRAFVSAGAELILTNTFTAALRPDEEIEALLGAGLARARAAAPSAFIVASLGPRGKRPLDVSRRLIAFLENADVDAVLFETVHIQLGKQIGRKFFGGVGGPHPVLISFVPDGIARTGDEWAGIFRGGISSLGFNCGDPGTTLAAGRALTSGRGLSFRPSAGLPMGEGRSLQWPVPPAAFGDFAEEARELGARIIGGCCGASPDHIAAIADRLRSKP